MKLNLPHICHICHICHLLSRFGVPFDKLRTGFGDQLESLQHPTVAALESFDSEDLPHGGVETVGADGVETVGCAPVFVGGVQLSEQVAWHGFVRLWPEVRSGQ